MLAAGRGFRSRIAGRAARRQPANATGLTPEWLTRRVTPAPRRRGFSLTTQIFIGLAIGVVVGAIVDATNPAWAVYFRPFSQLFLRLIKMIIAPLIFATLVAGIAGRRSLQGRRADGSARDHLLRDRHDPGAGHRARSR